MKEKSFLDLFLEGGTEGRVPVSRIIGVINNQ